MFCFRMTSSGAAGLGVEHWPQHPHLYIIYIYIIIYIYTGKVFSVPFIKLRSLAQIFFLLISLLPSWLGFRRMVTKKTHSILHLSMCDSYWVRWSNIYRTPKIPIEFRMQLNPHFTKYLHLFNIVQFGNVPFTSSNCEVNKKNTIVFLLGSSSFFFLIRVQQATRSPQVIMEASPLLQICHGVSHPKRLASRFWSFERELWSAIVTCFTPPKPKMEPENHPIERENHLPDLHFWVPDIWVSEE